MKKRILTAALLLAVCLGLAAPAAAAGRDWSIEQIATGNLGSFVVTSDHSLYTWGEYLDENAHYFGIKGSVYSALWPNGTYTSATKVMDDVQAVACGRGAEYNMTTGIGTTLPNLMILKTDGSLWMWGENGGCQLGQGNRETSRSRTDFAPVKVLDNVKTMDCRNGLCAAVTTGGDLYCWGTLIGTLNGQSSSSMLQYKYIPTPTKYLSNVVSVSCGGSHTLALTADGTVYGMGDRTDGRLGDGVAEGDPVFEMTRIMDDCIDVDAGERFSVAVKKDGTVYAWGSNTQCQFGKTYSEVPYYTTPTAIMTGVKDVTAGMDNIAYIKTDGSLWISGSSRFGIHGQGSVMYTGDSTRYPYKPVKVDSDVKMVEICQYAMLYVKNNNVMYGTGSSAEGVARYTYGPSHELYRATTAEYDGSAVVATPTIAGISCTPFYDVAPSAYCYGSILWARDSGIAGGTGSRRFSPDDTCTRGEVLTFLWRAAGSPSPQGGGAFSDVSGSDFYASAAQWAYEQGLVSGGTLGASAPCTRADVAIYLWKLAGSPAAGAPAFADVPAGADYGQAVSWALSQGIAAGTSPSAFSPNDACTRGQIVTFLYRAFAD